MASDGSKFFREDSGDFLLQDKVSPGSLQKKSLLSVIIINRNTAKLLIDCLGHVFKSELEQRPEVIVVDNGSTDDSVEQVRANYPEVKIIEAGRNLGFAAANNRAAEHASSECFLLVNTDAMLEPDCAAKLLSLMRQDPEIGMVGPKLLNKDGTLQTSFEAVPTLATECLNRSLLKRLFPKRYPGKHSGFTEPTPVEALIGAVMMIRCKAFEQLGGFDEDYFFFLEETDLAVRMRKNGWKVLHEPRAHAFHLQGATAKGNEAAARIEFYRSRYLFFIKHYGGAANCILTLVKITELTLNVAVLLLLRLLTFGKSVSITKRFQNKFQIWNWHLEGCPEGIGIQRV
jgi:GT2 family glycosyltransferase